MAAGAGRPDPILVSNLGHADRREPLRGYLTGLVLPGARKSVEPMAALLAPTRVRQTHQSLHHLVAEAPWEDEVVLQAVRKYACKNAGRTWRPTGQPHEVHIYDYPSLGVGPALPYGAYDVARNEGFVNLGVSHDTAEFAVERMRRWWRLCGRRHYRRARELLLCADGGGSNGHRHRAWKYFLQQFADEQGLSITVCHYPPGTSQWNKIEYRMFSFISLHWQGEPLVSYETIINLISTTTTKTGLRVRAKLAPRIYESGLSISDDEMKAVKLRRHRFHPEWNYSIAASEK